MGPQNRVFSSFLHACVILGTSVWPPVFLLASPCLIFQPGADAQRILKAINSAASSPSSCQPGVSETWHAALHLNVSRPQSPQGPGISLPGWVSQPKQKWLPGRHCLASAFLNSPHHPSSYRIPSMRPALGTPTVHRDEASFCSGRNAILNVLGAILGGQMVCPGGPEKGSSGAIRSWNCLIFLLRTWAGPRHL